MFSLLSIKNAKELFLIQHRIKHELDFNLKLVI